MSKINANRVNRVGGNLRKPQPREFFLANTRDERIPELSIADRMATALYCDRAGLKVTAAKFRSSLADSFLAAATA